MKVPAWRLWADDVLVVAGVLCIGVGLAQISPPWVLWCYAGAALVAAGAAVARC